MHLCAPACRTLEGFCNRSTGGSLGAHRFLLRKTAAAETLGRRLSAFERLVAHCVAGSGCRRTSLLCHFGEARLPLREGGVCCDLCSTPTAVAAAAARLSVHSQTQAAAAGSSTTAAEDGAAPTRKRAKRDKHNTGLVSSGESSADEAPDGPSARAPQQRSTAVPAARLSKGQRRASSGEVSLKLSALAAAEEDEEEEESGASKLRARLMR